MKRVAHAAFRPLGAIAAALALVVLFARAAYGWDSATHRLITRLAIESIPASALRDALVSNQDALERFSVEPDTVLRRKYGKAEELHHYINLEYFGRDPFAKLDPDFAVMRRRFGDRTLERSGTLPWTIEADSDAIASAWRRGDCATALRMSGYLAHYVGDASQPLHTTIHFDGYRGDRGVHRRLERAVDESVATLGERARSEVHTEEINNVWTPVIAEIRDAHGLVGEAIRNDRAARDEGDFNGEPYRRELMHEEGAMVAGQIARAASVLGSIWLYEWRQAGNPAICQSPALSAPW
jgi:Zinc dependent phospholipase C